MRVPSSPFQAVLVVTMLTATPSLAQQPQPQQRAWDWPEKAKNLKVMPQDTKKEQLQQTMIAFTRSLGVRCPFCHVGDEGQPLSTFDFASDKNPKKAIARDMMKMVGEVREDLGKMNLSGTHRVNVGCVTCHHGRPVPATLAEELGWTYESSGIDSTLAAYQGLRTRFYGRNAYDFGEGSLVEFGNQLLEKGKNDDAIRIMKMNVEQYPSSLRAHEGLAEGYAATGQKDLAIQEFKKMLEIDPNNRNAPRRIKDLEGASK